MINDEPDAEDNFVPHPWTWLVSELRRVFVGHVRLLMSGMPALLVGAAAVLFAIRLARTAEFTRLAPYVKGAARAMELGKYDLALLCTERLIQERASDPEPRYDYAMILMAKGDTARARSILNLLAPIDEVGYPPAQLALARSFIAAGLDPRTTVAIERHLEHALNGMTVANDARIVLGQIYAATGRIKQAESLLRATANQYPAVRLVLAHMARQRGDPFAAEVELSTATQVFRARVESNIDDIESRLLWARAVSAQSEFASAAKIIEQGLARADDPRFHEALARVYALWARSREGEGPSTAGERLGLLEQGLRHDPNHQALLEELAKLIEVGGVDVGPIRTVMQARIVDGKATSATHFVLGLDAFSRGKNDEARLHWEQAFRLEPRAALVANNLAWMLAHADPPDLARALELANRAVEQRPGQPRFRGTRAFVLSKLERWPEALTDLEAALAADPASIQTHLDLAEVYEKLGSPELASRHRDRAAVLKQSPAQNTAGLARPTQEHP